MKTSLRVLVVAALLASSGWLWAAWRAGGFIGESPRVAASLADPEVEAFSRGKHYVDVGPWRVAVIEEGQGDPVVLLHGCPFHSFEWRDVIPPLSQRYRVIAPDLLGLGATEGRLDDSYRV